MAGTELIRDFVNTRDIHDREEALARPSDLTAWLGEHGLLGGGGAASGADLRRALELREALRSLLLANTGVEVDRDAALAVLDGAARRARIELRFGEPTVQLRPAAAGVAAALGRLVVDVHGAMADGSWERLKACRASDCMWAFVDNAKNHSRAWCSMRTCGNREKARSFRERRRGVSPRSGSG